LKRPSDNPNARRAPAPPAPGSPRNAWIFRLAALVLIPLLLLLLAEVALRIAGYGYDTHLFSRIHFNGADYYVNNESFSSRFFPPGLTRWPNPILMPAQKKEGTFRIFVMGESAAQGDPQPPFGPARFMEALLRERYPAANIEVENVGITAINSHVILPIARECASHDGDLWVVYMGNNEMVGPFGAATVFGAQAPPVALVRFTLALQQTRVGQALMDVGRRLRKSDSAPKEWGGMQMFLGNQLPPEDPRKERVYRNFESNLRGIVRAGLNGGAAVVLSTVAVNLKDCPPFASIGLEGASAEFHLGRSLLEAGNAAAAREHLQKACDEDALPFRADSRINGAIRQEAERMTSPKLAFCDAARALETEQPDGVCGQETFYEHVHFNCDGAYRLGRLWAEQAAKFLPDPLTRGSRANWADEQTCDARLGLTAWNRGDVIHDVIGRLQRAPFTSQENNEGRLAALRAQLIETEKQRTPAQYAAAITLYSDAIRRAPGDYYLAENFGEFYELIEDPAHAAEQWRRAYELMPGNPFAYFTAGQVFARMGQIEASRTNLEEAISLHPGYAEAWLELGKVDAHDNHLDDALREYRRSAELQAAVPEVYLCIGKALSLQKKSAEALESFRHAVRLDPGYWEGHYALGGELGMHDQFAEAKSEFEQVARLNPKYALGHLNLGVALLKLNDYAGAREQFAETLRLDPANKTAREYLELATRGGR